MTPHGSIQDGCGRLSAARSRAAGSRAALVALSLAGLGNACLAADAINDLGSAFRPQALPVAPVAVSGERTSTNAPDLRVVVSSASRSLASIDGHVVHVGDVVNGMRVTQINARGVVLSGEGGVTERLLVSPTVVKRMRPADAARSSSGARP